MVEKVYKYSTDDKKAVEKLIMDGNINYSYRLNGNKEQYTKNTSLNFRDLTPNSYTISIRSQKK